MEEGSGEMSGVIAAEGSATAAPFQSRLQAKREERRRQKLLQQDEQQVEPTTTGMIEIREPEEFPWATTTGELATPALQLDARGRQQGPNENDWAGSSNREDSLVHPDAYRSFHSNTGGAAVDEEAALHRRQRAEARRAVLAFDGSIWDAVSSNALPIVEHYFLLEGAHSLLRQRHPSSSHAGHTLLHCAAWHGHYSIVQFLLTSGSDPNAVDSVVSKTTALLEAARAGHGAVCVLLMQHGANPQHRDAHGDTALHWAGRRRHGSVLLQIALELERVRSGSSTATWFVKNLQGKTVVDLISSSEFLMPLLQKRLGSVFTSEAPTQRHRSRFPIKAALVGANTRSLFAASHRADRFEEEAVRPGTNGSGDQPNSVISSRASTAQISSVAELGFDVSSFQYKLRGEEAA